MKTSLQELLIHGTNQLSEAGIAEAELDAKYLLYHAFQLDTVSFLMSRNDELSENRSNIETYSALLEKRCERIPLQYLIGTQEFMGLTFKVNHHVLIPRQDTETMVELVLKDYVQKDISVLDMCTGSGCIAISLKKLGRYNRVWASDISAEAIEVAKQNGVMHHTEINWVQSDLFETFPDSVPRFDVIISNPPYIPTKVIEGLEPEVRDGEPFLALDGLEDGLHFYRRLAKECGSHLKSGGSVYFEIGYDQGMAVSGLLEENGYKSIEIIKDEPGLVRIVKGIYIGGFHV